MRCPQCQEENPDRAKFCLNCGAKLALVCPECGASLPAQAKFCFECGTPVGMLPPAPPPTPPPERDAAAIAAALERLVPKEFAERLLATQGKVGSERRVVTILFSDIKGSTAMAETLDPEDVMDIMDGAFDVLIEPIYRHEGTLARLMGDAVLAFFGAPIAHENDPERAIRAALEIVEGAKAYAARLEKQRGIHGFDVRVGINTGLVVVGEVGSDLRVEYTAMGDAINLASRMEQSAPVGGILITHDTYRHVRGLFEVRALEPVAVKGKAEPVQVYLVQRAKPRAFRLETRGVEGIETRMVGREAELKRLQDAFYLALEDRERQMVTITGEAGVGKSRLLYEFENWLELRPEPIQYFRGRANQELRNVPYALLRDVLAFHVQIQESDAAQVVREKLERGIVEVLGEDEQGVMKAHFVGQLLGFDFSTSPYLQGVIDPEGIDDPEQLRDRALIYLSELFQAIAVQAAAVILLEDIHWADDSSLDAVSHLALSLPDQHLLIVCLARPPLFDRRPHWGEGHMFHLRMEIQPLSKRESRRLVEEILQRMEDVPAALRELVVSGAEGNPLYVEELIKMLIEETVIVVGEECWQIEAERLADMRVPPTLTGVLQARLDSLPLEQRSVLQQAAVVGRTFWDRVIARIGEVIGEGLEAEEVPTVLFALRGREMVSRRETSAFVGAQEFIFKHAALREVAYESILRRVRRGYHALVAEWLIEQGGDRIGEYTGLIANHLDLAGQLERALPYLQQAGEQAAAQFANSDAAGYFGRALEILERLGLEPASVRGQRYALLLGREAAYALLGEREAQAADLEQLAALAEEVGDDRRRAEVALRRAAYREAVSEYPAALAAAQEAVSWAERAGDMPQKIGGLIACGRALMRQGIFEEARQRLAEALALARQHQDRSGEATSLHYLGTVLYFLGDTQGARGHLEQALAIRRAIDDRRGEAVSLNNLAGVHHAQGDFSQAKVVSEQALAAYQAIGDRWNETYTLSNLGVIYYEALGELSTARDCYQRALDLFQVLNDRRGEALVARNLGLVLHDLDDDEAARRRCEQALMIDRAIGDRSGEGDSLTNLALALEGLGRLAAAAAAYQDARQLRHEIGQDAKSIDDLAGLARVALKQGQTEQASGHVKETLDWIAAHGVDGIEYPLRVYLSCVDVLAAVGQTERAEEVLMAARTMLQERAARVSDEATRQAFLEQVPLHRQIHERLARSG